jgi:hypothetical protein
MPIAEKQYNATLKQLKTLLTQSDDSLRSFCAKTQSLGPHEQIYHSNLSEIFNATGRYNLSLQQFFMMLKLLGHTPARFFAGSEQASLIASGFNKLDEKEQATMAKSMARLLENKTGAKTIARRLTSNH